MKRYCLLFPLWVASTSLSAQQAVDVSYAEDRQGNFVFSCNNKAHCNYVLDVKFNTLENGHADHTLPFEAEVKPGVTKLFTIIPEPAKGALQMKYAVVPHKGCLPSSIHPNPDFTYLLPVAPGKEVQVYRVINPGAPDSSYAVRIRMKPGDTIYAARRGIVNEVYVANTENDAGVNVTGEWNKVEIVHADCSFAQYGVLKKDGALVKPGDVVEPGTPIGIVGGDKFGRGSDIRFNVTYYPNQPNSGLPLQFWTKRNGKAPLKHGGTYTSEFPRALIIQEKKPATPAKTAPSKKAKSKTNG
jgi:murein DD-endopeptidase MepM/ murein hydrolase activator NlpD